MGTYRFLLAIGVLISHTKIDTFGYEIGVVAVTSFFLISGYLNTCIIEKYYKNRIINYYVDRFIRIAPLYFFYFILIIIINYFLKIKVITIFQIILEIPIIINGYFYLLDNILGISWWKLTYINPPTWSLGTEITFYILIPFIIILKKYFNIIFLLSLLSYLIIIIFFKDYHDPLGYRFLPFTLYIFLLGGSLFYISFKKNDLIKIAIFIFVILTIIINYKIDYYKIHFAKEIALGILSSIFFVSYLKDIKNKIDMYLGGLSYGIFLNHFFIIEILDKYLIESEIKKTFIAILTSVIFSSVTYHFIEKYSSIFREKIRYNNK